MCGWSVIVIGNPGRLPFPALGGNQRPCVHRLLSGNLVFVGDLQVKGGSRAYARRSWPRCS